MEHLHSLSHSYFGRRQFFFTYTIPAHFTVPVRNTNTIIEFKDGLLEVCKKSLREYICQTMKIRNLIPEDNCISRDAVRIDKLPSECQFTVQNSYQPFFQILPNSEKIIFTTITNTSSTPICGNKSSSRTVN